MKTITEFPGLSLRQAYQLRQSMLPEPPKQEKGPRAGKGRRGRKGPPGPRVGNDQDQAQAEARKAADRTTEAKVDEAQAEGTLQAKAQEMDPAARDWAERKAGASDVAPEEPGTGTVVNPPTGYGSGDDAVSLQADASATEATAAQAEPAATESKDVTEGSGESAAAQEAHDEAVQGAAAGASEGGEKPADGKVDPEKVRAEISQKVSESLKIEGEKLDHAMNALEVIDRRRVQDLRRVVVFQLAEGEKAPQGSVQKGEFHYRPEYLPPLNPPKRAEGRDGEQGRGRGRGRGKGRGKGRDDRRGGRGRSGQGAGAGGERGGRGAGRGDRGRGAGGAPQITPKA